MNHIRVTHKTGKKVLAHEDEVAEVFDLSEGHSLMVMRFKDKEGQNVKIGIKESADQVYDMLINLGETSAKS